MYNDSEGSSGVEAINRDEEFNRRKKKGDKCISRIITMLDETEGYIYNYSGWEKNVPDIFLENMRQCRGKTPESIKHYPDFQVMTPFKEVWLLDGKNSKSIEKGSYIACQELVQIGQNVAFVFMINNESILRAINFPDLKFTKVKQRPGGVPIIDDWLCPYKLDKEKKNEWKKKHHGSATPYKYIDFKKSHYITFKQFLEKGKKEKICFGRTEQEKLF